MTVDKLKKRDVYAADALQEIIERNAKWLTRFMEESIKSLMKDKRPLFTEKISEQERLASLLTAPPEFWARLESNDPETAAALAASIVRARQQGKIPAEGPLADQVSSDDADQEETV